MSVLIHEKCLGIDEMVDDLVSSYKDSCRHNGTDEKDLEYFQRYVFVILATMAKGLELDKQK